MKIILLLVGLALCGAGCDRDPASQLSVGQDAKLIAAEETRQIAIRVLLNRYPEAQIISELFEGATATYSCATNGTTLPVVVVVDRQTAQSRFETLKR